MDFGAKQAWVLVSSLPLSVLYDVGQVISVLSFLIIKMEGNISCHL